MKDRVYLDYIQDIMDSIRDVESFVKGMSFEEFSKDRKTINAVVRSIEVIGEASKKIPQNIAADYPNVPWKKMAGMRDKLIHEYFGIDPEILWQVAKEDLRSIRPDIRLILSELKR